jgi:ABC-type multidrug transport system ATPase subunit
MKRRLSILLSTIGNPKVIFLDEPTTGLDPVNKRFIWTMIQNIKKDKSVILTTHSMEEADFLSDRIGVIVDGNFKCIGTPVEVKSAYGGGYLLTFGILLLIKYAIMKILKRLKILLEALCLLRKY